MEDFRVSVRRFLFFVAPRVCTTKQLNSFREKYASFWRKLCFCLEKIMFLFGENPLGLDIMSASSW